MWAICAAISVIFCILGWVLTAWKKTRASWAAACSLAFTALTMLMEYRMVFHWVKAADWAALSDVVPSAFPMLSGYVILMLLGNVIPVVMRRK